MNILIISHFFAPYSKVGAKRMSIFAQYLVQKGENVFVLKAKDEEYGEDILTRTYSDHGITVFSIDFCFHNLIVKKLTRSRLYWKKAEKIIRENEIDTVIISSGPFNYLAIIPKLKHRNPNVKYIIDFRDLLDGMQCKNEKISFLQRVGYYIDRIAEHNAVMYADLCLTVSDMMNETYKDRYVTCAEKFICIQNGYDDISINAHTISIIENNKPSILGEKMLIGIFGKYGFYDETYCTMLAEAVADVNSEGIKAKIVQFGVKETALFNAFLKIGIAEQYAFIPSHGYEQDILGLMHMNATIASNCIKDALGTKMFDYILINRPIITINPYEDSALVKLTKEFVNGFYCKDKEQLKKAIICIKTHKIDILDADNRKRKQYGRQEQYSKLYRKIYSL